MRSLVLIFVSVLASITFVAGTSTAQRKPGQKPHSQATVKAAQVTDAYIDVRSEPRLLEPIEPKYPASALRKKLAGSVTVSVFIDKDGRVEQVRKQYATDPVFVKAACAAAMKAHYDPAIAPDGNPVGLWWSETIRFRPEDSLPKPQGRLMVSRLPNSGFIPVSEISAPEIHTDVSFHGAQSTRTLVDSFASYAVYPQAALHKGLEGTVSLRLAIDHKGDLASVSVRSVSDSIFLTPALDAISHARYEPLEAADTTTTYQNETVSFRLENALGHVSSRAIGGLTQMSVPEHYARKPRMRYDIHEYLVYPDEAKRLGLQGVVKVSAHINDHGIVEETAIEDSSNPIFNLAAQTAVEHMLFDPAIGAGGPVKTWWTVPVVFRLESASH